MNNQKIIVLGGKGQLGEALAQESAGDERFVFLSSAEADVRNADQLQHVFEQYQPAYVVNCSAYTAVDKAEDEPLLAKQLNADALRIIAKLCLDYQTTLIHISTDFVFEGKQTDVLTETDETKPVGIYGSTKLEGEGHIRELMERYVIIRTSWLYSEFGNNFAKTMLRLAKERSQLRVVADQIGTPTYARDLAKAIIQIIGHEKVYGLFHYSNEGVASWYDFAHEIFEIKEIPIQVEPIKSSQFPTKAQRPAFSVLDKSKIKEAYGLHIPHWRDSLTLCLSRL